MRIPTRTKFRAVGLVLVLISLLVLAGPSTFSTRLQAEAFADPAFQKLWEKNDKPVADHAIVRPWLWGDAPFANKQEPYDEAFSGTRLVQYFDKSRMELNNPYGDKNSAYYVTNGLLTKELVSGRMQVGDNRYQEGLPAEIPVAGDSANNPDCPSYASFGRAGVVSLASGENRATDATGQSVISRLNQQGQVSSNPTLAGRVTNAYYEPNLGHNIPDVFWNYLNRLDSDWVYVMGYPISEPYWSQAVVGGVSREVLVQLFERRVLTYTPANSSELQVEMGNIGRHYYQWRYGAGSAHVLNYLLYQSEVSRTRYVIGILQNDSNQEQRIGITASLLDGAGQSLAESSATIDTLAIVAAKGKTPFKIIIEHPPTDWKDLRFNLTFLPYLKTFKSSYNYSLQAAGVTPGKTITNLPRLTGRLTNLSPKASRNSQVFAVAYDSDGNVVDVDLAYTDPQQIEPGSSAPFELLFLHAHDFAQYDLFTEGRN